ncbi:MAG: 2-phospho-L-lactate transferase [Mycobacteriales bacterium]
MTVTVLAGGVGGARFVRGVRAVFGRNNSSDDAHPVTVIGNVGDDLTLFGLRVCPDLDTLMYTLGDGIDAERGWGRRAEAWTVREELAAYGDPRGWFALGDRDLATHLLRSEWLAQGAALSEVTERLCARWQPGVRLLPASDAPVETYVELADGRWVHFQEWWVRLHAAEPASRFEFRGAASARPAPGVLAAIADADLVLLAPSNPVVSIGPILAIPGVRSALATARAPIIGVSPIIGGAPVRGMADACLAAEGIATSAEAVARRYGRREDGGVIDGWLVDTEDAAAAERLRAAGYEAVAVPLLMSDLAATEAMVRSAVELAGRLRPSGSGK